MSDFHQGGVITTLHDRLEPSDLEVLERDLETTAAIRPVALVLPCLGSELVTYTRLPHDTMARFARAIRLAPDAYKSDPVGQPLIPSWNRVLAALPDIFDRLVAAVDRDNA